MMKRSETLKIKKLEKKWAKDLAWFNSGCKDVFRRVKRFFGKEMEEMMYGVRPNNTVDRFEHAFWWWMKLFIVLYAIKGVGII